MKSLSIKNDLTQRQISDLVDEALKSDPEPGSVMYSIRALLDKTADGTDAVDEAIKLKLPIQESTDLLHRKRALDAFLLHATTYYTTREQHHHRPIYLAGAEMSLICSALSIASLAMNYTLAKVGSPEEQAFAALLEESIKAEGVASLLLDQPVMAVMTTIIGKARADMYAELKAAQEAEEAK